MKRLTLIFGTLTLLALLVFGLGLFNGTLAISPLHYLTWTPAQKLILLQLRLPRLLNALLVGGSLSVAGAAFQGILQNPLADPYVLGVSAGAGLGAALAILLGLIYWNTLAVPLCAFAGALLALYAVYGVVHLTKRKDPLHYILVGIMMNAFFSSIMLVLLFCGQKQLTGVMAWLMGDLSQLSLSRLAILFPIALILILLLMKESYALTILTLGDNAAKSLGIMVERLRSRVFIYASLLTGLAVSCAGIIGFVGLVIPHLLRLIIRDDFRILIPASFILGGTFLMAADTLSRSVFPPYEIPVGIFASFIGGPFFILILIQATRGRQK
jgi:iron complex transport system permease protein